MIALSSFLAMINKCQPDYCHVLLFIVHGLSAYYILVIEDTKSNEIHNGVQMCLILVYYLVASCSPSYL